MDKSDFPIGFVDSGAFSSPGKFVCQSWCYAGKCLGLGGLLLRLMELGALPIHPIYP